MHDADEELREVKREIIESRALVIRTNNLTNALSADIKSIAKRQQTYERTISWNSGAAYVVFVLALFTSLKLLMDARIEAMDVNNKHLRDENTRLRQDLDAARQRDADRQAAELESAKFYDLLKQGRRADLIKGWEAMRNRPLTKAESQFFAESVEKARGEQAEQLYVQGLESSRLQRWQEAASAFEDSLRYEDTGVVAQQTRLELAEAYRKLRRQKDAITILDALTESNVDKDIQDDALEQLAWCQTEMEAYNDAKNTWRTLLRKFPDSHYTGEAKLALQTLVQYH
jgi:TolA-binding protein